MSIRKIPRSNIVEKNQSFWLVIHFHIDVCDAMGANCASTVAEGIAPSLQALSGGQIGFRIVSNMNPERCSKVFQIISHFSIGPFFNPCSKSRLQRRTRC